MDERNSAGELDMRQAGGSVLLHLAVPKYIVITQAISGVSSGQNKSSRDLATSGGCSVSTMGVQGKADNYCMLVLKFEIPMASGR